MKTMNKVVIKIGSSSLIKENGKSLSRSTMLELVQQITQLRSQGLEIILISSGAVATGKSLFNPETEDKSLALKQTYASLGQIKLMQVWSDLFSLFDYQVGQILLTKENFSADYQTSLQSTLACFYQHKIIPILNENDASVNNENSVGDNDNLAALVAQTMGADTLILLTDQEGLYTADPRIHSHACLIPQLTDLDENILSLAGNTSSTWGRGGMQSKIKAAGIAMQAKMQTIIASAKRRNVLLDLFQGKQIGTLVTAPEPS